MHRIVIGSAALLAAIGSAAQAQTVVHWSSPRDSEARRNMAYFPMGTPVLLKMRTQVSTRDNKSGDRFYLDVAEDLTYRGQVVVPAGSLAIGEVVRSDPNGFFGKPGLINIRVRYLETPYGPVRLSGDAGEIGKDGKLASFLTIAFVSGLGFLVHGHSAHVPFDATVTAYLAEDLHFPAGPALAPEVRTLPARFDPTVFSNNVVR